MTRHPSAEDLLLHCYEPDAAVEAHAATCEACRASLVENRAFLALLTKSEPPVPERPEVYGRALAARLAPRLTPRGRFLSRLQELFAPRRLALAGGLLALVAVAFLAGRRWPAEGGIPAAARERILLVAVGDHLDRSQLVLLELLNSQDEPASAPARAAQLVSESRLYRQAALRSGDRAVASVLDDLERLLLDVSHASPLSSDERDALRRRIEKSGVLFKVRILGSRLASEETARARSSRT